MTERTVDDGIWGEEFMLSLPTRAKTLFRFLSLNESTRSSGLYRMPLSTVAHFTGIAQEELPEMIQSLSPEVEWWPDKSLFWVRNFVLDHCRSGTFLVAVAKALKQVRCPEIVQEYLDYNRSQGYEIPYPYAKVGVSGEYPPEQKRPDESRAEEKSNPAPPQTPSRAADPLYGKFCECYEQAIGQLNSLIAQEIQDFLCLNQNCPIEWIPEAFKEAAVLNKRNWRYVQRILERWMTEGRGEPTRGRNSKPGRTDGGAQATSEELERSWKGKG